MRSGPWLGREHLQAIAVFAKARWQARMSSVHLVSAARLLEESRALESPWNQVLALTASLVNKGNIYSLRGTDRQRDRRRREE